MTLKERALEEYRIEAEAAERQRIQHEAAENAKAAETLRSLLDDVGIKADGITGGQVEVEGIRFYWHRYPREYTDLLHAVIPCSECDAATTWSQIIRKLSDIALLLEADRTHSHRCLVEGDEEHERPIGPVHPTLTTGEGALIEALRELVEEHRAEVIE